MGRMENTESATRPTPKLETTGDELQEAGSGRSPATPAWMLLSVGAVVAMLFAVAITLVTIAYVLS